jgi:hypothetical protein
VPERDIVCEDGAPSALSSTPQGARPRGVVRLHTDEP